MQTLLSQTTGFARRASLFLMLALMGSVPAFAQGEADLKLPDLGSVEMLGMPGDKLLLGGLLVSVLGLVFGLMMFKHLRDLPVHQSMLEISELIYETCKTYLQGQGKFLLILEVFIGAIILFYFFLTIEPVFVLVNQEFLHLFAVIAIFCGLPFFIFEEIVIVVNVFLFSVHPLTTEAHTRLGVKEIDREAKLMKSADCF